MSNEFKIENVPYYPQRDNLHDPYTSCFNTSLAMCTEYCLTLIGKDKTTIGCSPDKQLEDYIYELLDDPETTQWMRKNIGILGTWVWKYKRRTIYQIEAYIFNRLMNTLGYKATFVATYTYDQVCNKLEETKLPMVIGGDFSSVSSVGGHMNCLIGFNRLGVKEFFVSDPFGNALTGYKVTDGKNMRYSYKYYLKDTNKHYVVVIEKIK